MNGDLVTFFIGAAIGILGSILGYCLNHFLKLREKSVIREFEMRKEGREFYLPLYAHLATLADLVEGYLKAVKDGKVYVIVEGSYKTLDPKNVASQFKQAFEDFVQFWDRSRKAGYELFISDDMFQLLVKTLHHSMQLSKQTTWDSKSARLLIEEADSAMKRIEEEVGIRRKPWKERLWKRK